MQETKAQLPMRLQNEDGSVTVRLFAPIQYGKEELIEELRVVRPKAKHVKNMKTKDQTMGDMLSLLSKLTSVPPSVLDELDMVDVDFLAGVVDDFLDNTAKNGKLA